MNLLRCVTYLLCINLCTCWTSKFLGINKKLKSNGRTANLFTEVLDGLSADEVLGQYLSKEDKLDREQIKNSIMANRMKVKNGTKTIPKANSRVSRLVIGLDQANWLVNTLMKHKQTRF